MARKLRFEYEGAIDHVMNRGDRREAIVLNDKDRDLFIKTVRYKFSRSNGQLPDALQRRSAVSSCLH
jgi:hypothetical protein